MYTLTFDDSINVAHCRRQTGVEYVSRRVVVVDIPRVEI